MKYSFSLIISIFVSLISYGQTFYYGSKGKVALLQSSTKAIVSYKQGATIPSSDGLTYEKINSSLYMVSGLKTNVTSYVNQNMSSPSVAYSYPVYNTSKGGELGLSNEICVKLKSTVTEPQFLNAIASFGLSVKNRDPFYILIVPSLKNGLDIANKIYEMGLCEFSHPNFIIKSEKFQHIPNDEYFNRQVALHNTGQVFTDNHSGTSDADIDGPEAWDITTGSSDIIVAVIDEGVSSNHPDLPNTRQVRLNGSNFNAANDGTSANDPSPVGNADHGNACAGIIGATMDNNQGIAGIASNSKIMPIRMFSSGFLSDYANMFNFAVNNGANIISCSWGFTGSVYSDIPVISAAIQNAINNNVPVIFAAGNTSNHVANDDGVVLSPANFDIEGLITVGATDRYDNQANYSPTSNPSIVGYNQIIDISAPSHRAYNSQIAGESLEMYSLDIPGTAGYNQWNETGWGLPAVGEINPSTGTNNLSYTARMGGTSFATPVVAGVAALVLSIDPDLTPVQLMSILTSSADKVGNVAYNSDGWSAELGAGRVNAFNAVMRACPDNYTISWPLSQNINYQSGNYIIANNIVNSGSDVDITAKNRVTLKSGFKAKSGSKTRVYISGCTKMSGISTSNNLAEKKYAESTSDEIAMGDENNSDSQYELSVYPNPSSGIFNISAGDEIIHLSVISASGINVFSKEMHSKSLYIDLSKQSKGLYFLTITTKSNSITKRIELK